MIRKVKKGFTLVELLSVIVIIAIIMVITTPIVVNIIEEARKTTFKISAQKISKNAKTKITRNALKGNKISITFTYEDGIESSVPEGYKLNYKGTKPQNGIVIANKNGKVGVALHNGTWCALKGFDETEVTLEELNYKECIDRIKPLTITLNGSIKEYVEINTSYEESGVVAVTIEGEIIKNIKKEIKYNNEIVESIDVSKLRTYEIVYMAEHEGYTAITRRQVIVQDTMPPVLTIPSNITLTVNEVSNFDYLSGVAVTDNSLESITPTLTSDLKPYPGEYTVIYSVKDSSGNETSMTRYITVVDVGYPEITILGSNPVDIDMGSIYVDLGATATDDVDGDITDKIVTTGTVNINVPGTYIITYEAADKSGNKTTVTRTVNVIDNVPPTVTFGINGNSTSAQSRNTTVIVTDNVAVDANSLKYLWNTSTTAPTEASFTSSFTSGGILTSPAGVTGGYYLWILAKDVIGNVIITRSNVFNLDNTIPTVTFGTNGHSTYAKSRSTTVTVSDNIGVNTSTLKYLWNTSTSTPSETSFTSTFTNGGTISSPTNVTGGYYLWILAKDTSGNIKIGRSNVFNLDNTIPTVTFGTNGHSTYAKSRSTTVTVSDNIGVNTSTLKYLWNTSTSTPSETSFTSTFTNGGTISSPTNVTGGYYLWILVKDTSGNTKIGRSNVFNLDNTIPTVTFGTNGSSTYAKSRSTTVTVSDNIGVNTSALKYLWNTSTSTPSETSFVNTFTNGGTISSPTGVTGGYYLWILAKDTSGNTRIGRSNVFNLDNVNPIISSVVSGASNLTEKSFTITRSGNAIDAHSGLATNPYLYQISTNGTSWTTKCTNNTTSCAVTGLTDNTTYYYRICVNDLLGNQSCIASKTTKTIEAFKFDKLSVGTYVQLQKTDGTWDTFRKADLEVRRLIKTSYIGQSTWDGSKTMANQYRLNFKSTEVYHTDITATVSPYTAWDGKTITTVAMRSTLYYDEIIRYTGGASKNLTDWRRYTGSNYWTWSPAYNDGWYVTSTGSLTYTSTTRTYNVRFALVLRKDLYVISGSGTSSSPYRLSETLQ